MLIAFVLRVNFQIKYKNVLFTKRQTKLFEFRDDYFRNIFGNAAQFRSVSQRWAVRLNNSC